MADATLVFALELTHWDASGDPGESKVVAIPTLSVFANAALAASSNEGLTIVEGDLWFFAADGSPLEVVFSEQPYMDNERGKYFAGKYSLEAGPGQTLGAMLSGFLADVPAERTKIIVRLATSDDVAREHGWQDAESLKSSANHALEIAVPDMTRLIDFDIFPLG